MYGLLAHLEFDLGHVLEPFLQPWFAVTGREAREGHFGKEGAVFRVHLSNV